MKQCNCCKRPLPCDHVGPKYCCEACAQKVRKRAKQNQKRSNERRRIWRMEHPELAKEQSRIQGIKWRSENPTKANDITRRYQARNPERTRAIHIRHRARKRNADGNCSVDQLQARIDFYGGLCWVPGCCKPYEAIDHVIPLAKDGSNWPSNLRPICRRHNSSKGSRSLTDFLKK